MSARHGGPLLHEEVREGEEPSAAVPTAEPAAARSSGLTPAPRRARRAAPGPAGPTSDEPAPAAPRSPAATAPDHVPAGPPAPAPRRGSRLLGVVTGASPRARRARALEPPVAEPTEAPASEPVAPGAATGASPAGAVRPLGLPLDRDDVDDGWDDLVLEDTPAPRRAASGLGRGEEDRREADGHGEGVRDAAGAPVPAVVRRPSDVLLSGWDDLPTAAAPSPSPRAAAGRVRAPVDPAPLAPAPVDPAPVDPAAVVPARTSRPRAPRRLVVAALAAVLVVVLLAAGLALRADGEDARVLPPVGTAERGQRVLLLSTTASDDDAAVSALLAADVAAGAPDAAPAALVLLPGRLLTDVPGVGSAPLAEAAALPGPEAARAAVADLLGVTVDGRWDLGGDGLAALVDAVGGVQVDVADEVTVPREDGSSLVALPPGRQTLDGAQVTQWLAAPDDAGGLGRLPRLQQVLTAVVRALPADAEGARDVLRPELERAGLGGDAADQATAVLLAAGTAARAGALDADALPVVPVDTGGSESSWRADPDAVQRLVDRSLAASVPPGRRDGERVLVLNGVGTPGIGLAVRDRLVQADLVFVGSRNAVGPDGSFGVAESVVLVGDATAASRATGERVATSLGLPPTAVRVSSREQTVADVVVVVGADFRP